MTNEEAIDAMGEVSAEPNLTEWLDAQVTREQWLTRALHEFVLPNMNHPTVAPMIRVSCGWTGAGYEGCTLGATYKAECSADGAYEIFVSPAVADPVKVLGILMHETAHALSGCDGHGDTFEKVCSAALLVAGDPWPTCAVPGQMLEPIIEQYVGVIGAYPHASLTPPPPTVVVATGEGTGTRPPPTTQSTRLLKASCSSCGYIVRVTMKWASTGLPTCPCGAGVFSLASVDALAAAVRGERGER